MCLTPSYASNHGCNASRIARRGESCSPGLPSRATDHPPASRCTGPIPDCSWPTVSLLTQVHRIGRFTALLTVRSMDTRRVQPDRNHTPFTRTWSGEQSYFTEYSVYYGAVTNPVNQQEEGRRGAGGKREEGIPRLRKRGCYSGGITGEQGLAPHSLPKGPGGAPRTYREESRLMIALLKTRLPAIPTWDVHDWLVSWLALARPVACHRGPMERHAFLVLRSFANAGKRQALHPLRPSSCSVSGVPCAPV
jgi:hypothetical protein